MLSYEILKILWWAILGILLMGFAITDGFDLGTAILLPFVTKTNTEKRILLQTVGPVWESNQVWFILGGGAIFAAWPLLYSLSFSGFYLAMLIVLIAFILRPVSFKYRSKIDNSLWQNFWDFTLCLSGIIPAVIFGVAIGNILQGVPFYFDEDLRVVYTGSFLGLLNPFALCCGLTSFCMLTMHGAFYLNTKTEGLLQLRLRKTARIFSLLTMLFFIGSGILLFKKHIGYAILEPFNHNGLANPLHKIVVEKPDAWFLNYKNIPFSIAIPIIAIVSMLLAALSAGFKKFAFTLSSISIINIIATVGFSMFPFLLPSSSHPGHSLTVWDSSASEHTLFIMLISACIFMPIIICYVSWVYRILAGSVTATNIKDLEPY